MSSNAYGSVLRVPVRCTCQVLGKPKLKWSRLAEHLERSKKDVKAKYSAMTGEDVE